MRVLWSDRSNFGGGPALIEAAGRLGGSRVLMIYKVGMDDLQGGGRKVRFIPVIVSTTACASKRMRIGRKKNILWKK